LFYRFFFFYGFFFFFWFFLFHWLSFISSWIFLLSLLLFYRLLFRFRLLFFIALILLRFLFFLRGLCGIVGSMKFLATGRTKSWLGPEVELELYILNIISIVLQSLLQFHVLTALLIQATVQISNLIMRSVETTCLQFQSVSPCLPGWVRCRLYQ